MRQWSGDSLGSPYGRAGRRSAARGDGDDAGGSDDLSRRCRAPRPTPLRQTERGSLWRWQQCHADPPARRRGRRRAVACRRRWPGDRLHRGQIEADSTRSALRASRAQLVSVQGALSGDTKALQAEQTVGTYLRGVRDALAPALAAYGASANAGSAAAARANDEQAIAALTVAKQKISALTLLDSLRTADGDIRAAMDALAGGLQSEVTAIGTGSLSGLTLPSRSRVGARPPADCARRNVLRRGDHGPGVRHFLRAAAGLVVVATTGFLTACTGPQRPQPRQQFVPLPFPFLPFRPVALASAALAIPHNVACRRFHLAPPPQPPPDGRDRSRSQRPELGPTPAEIARPITVPSGHKPCDTTGTTQHHWLHGVGVQPRRGPPARPLALRRGWGW